MTALVLLTHLLAAVGGAALGALAFRLLARRNAAPAAAAQSTFGDEALLETVDRFRLTANAAGISIWDWDLERDQVRTDARMINPDIYGALGEYVDRRKFLNDMLHPEDRAPFIQAMETVFHSNCEHFTHRYRVRRPDGEFAHLQLYGRAFRNASGKALRLFALNVDVTEHTLLAQRFEKQAEDERALRERLNSQAGEVQALADRISVATEAAGLYVWEMDARTGEFTWVGNQMRLFGLGELSPEAYGRALTALVEPEDRTALRREATRAFAEGRPTFSYRFRMTREGITRHMLTYAHIVRDAAGVAVRLVGATSDITNEVQSTELLQRKAEEERALVDRLAMATQAAGISSWEVDLNERRFLWVENRIDGLENSPDEGDSTDRFSERVVPEDRDNFSNAIRDALARGTDRCSYRYRVRTLSGALVHTQNHARVLLDQSGRPARALGVTWDVTGEAEAAAKLELHAQRQRELAHRLTLSTEAAGISCWEVDLDARRFTFVDESIKQLHGVAEFGGTTEEFFSAINAEDAARFLELVREAVANGRDRFSHRYRMHTAGGRAIHIQTHVHVIIDAGGRARRLLGVSWDITKEIEAAQQLHMQAQQLRDAERRLERASRSSSEGHWESDLLTGRLWCSSSYQELLGYAPQDMPQTVEQIRRLVHPEDVVQIDATIRSHIESGAAFNCDARLRVQGGQYRWFRHRGMVERSADGTAASLSGSVHDIHDQKLAEDALRLAQQRFERAINGTQDGLWELEHDGAAWISPRVAELLAYAPEELPADTNVLGVLLHPEDASAVAIAAQAHFQQGAPYDVEIRLRTRTGDYRWFRARATAARDEMGRPMRLSGSLQDVTDARAAREALLRATEAAEAANRAKSDFLANVSHEIRTPLNGVVGMTGLLLDTTLDRTQRDYAETIRTSADSLLIVINDILDFSKIEAGRLDIESLEFDLHGVVEDVGSMMAFQAAAKNLELVVHVHPDAPARVTGDPQRVRQCLLNLLGNAIKFTTRGEIVIEVRTAGVRDGRVLTQFEVRDTGIGVAAHTLKTLFEPFVQADSSTTRHFGGTGLGLSIVRRLAEMMGGEVGASSEVGKGSSFWFTLPLAPAVQSAVDAPLDLRRVGRRVLVVDDNETNRRVLAGQLMRAGYEVSLAGSGVEALSMMRQASLDRRPFEVVLADHHMRDMDGAVLGERINADPELSSSRMVMLTSMDRHGDLQRFASLGFAAYLTKPVRTRELLDCLDRVLARDAREWHLQSQPIVTRSALASHDAGRRYACRVLLVEDNPVNQKVAVRFLERMGCSVRLADNGAEGLKAFAESAYDIVLMDLQMPVMDGLTAAQRIRDLERAGTRRTPIVALTANAMSGQLERCLGAGMDGFLTKPIELARLYETFDRYGLGTAPEASAIEGPAPLAQTPVQLARLNEITEGDAEFAHELARTFIASGAQVLEEIRAAFRVFDRTALTRGAHKLKGASANIHAGPLRDLSLRLETQAAHLDQPSLAELIDELDQQFERAAEFLRANAPERAKEAASY
jgi:two-component system, sensor histidine kinase and response regulator